MKTFKDIRREAKFTADFPDHDHTDKDFVKLARKNRVKISRSKDGYDTIITGDEKGIIGVLKTMYGKDYTDYYKKKGNSYVSENSLKEKVKDGKVDPLSKMGKQKLTSLEISNYYKDNPSQKKAARDKDVKKGIELALDLGGAQTYAVKELEKFKRGLSKHPAVKKALQHANEQVESLEEKISPKEFSKLQGTYKDKISGAVIEFDSQGFVVEPKNGKVVPFEWKNMMAEGVISEGTDTYKGLIAGLEKDKKEVASKSINRKVFGQSATKHIDKAINFLKMLEKEGIPAGQISQSDFVTSRSPAFFIGNPNKSPSLSKFTPNDVKKAVKHAKKMGIIKEAVSPAQQAAIAIAKKEKGEKPKTEHKGQFIYAAKQAKKKGEKTFVFAGKTYNCEEVLEDKEICPKCEGKGCDHCNDIGYHEAHKKGSKCKTESFISFVSEEVANITVDPRNKLNSGQQQSYYAMEIVKNARRFGLKGAVMHKHVRIKGPKKKVNDFLRTVIGKSSYGDPTEKDMTTPQVDKMLNKGMKGRNEEKLNEAKSSSGYELYHRNFSGAMQHAYAHAKKKGFIVDKDDIDKKVAMGPKKPSSGKTNKYILDTNKKQKLHVQVANLDNKRYELNMYIESVQIDESVISDVKDIVAKKQAKKIQGVMVDMFTASAISQIYDKVNDTNKAKMDKLKITQLANLAMKLMKKEETELEEDAKVKEISRLTGTRPQAVQDFISKNNLDVFKLLQYVGRGKSPERMAFSNAISSKPNSKTKNFIKQFQEETELEEKRFSAKRDAMRDMGKSGKDSADVDDYKATDDDRKAASKNVISQIRRGCDMPKGVMVKFKDGSSKNFPKKACQLVMTKFDSIKKPMVKRKFQDMVNQSFAGLKKAMSMKG